LNASNYESGTASTFRNNFPVGAVKLRDSKISVGTTNIFYSWRDKTASYGNSTYQIIFPTSIKTTTLKITMSNGFYDVSDINSYLQQTLFANELYLIN
jgi:hypothetical protein